MVQVRKADNMIRQFCRRCENEYGHEFNPQGPWMRPTIANLALIENAEREHDQKHHTPRASGKAHQ